MAERKAAFLIAVVTASAACAAKSPPPATADPGADATLRRDPGRSAQGQRARTAVVRTAEVAAATIEGVVVSSSTGEPVPYASIQLDGGQERTQADSGGHFRIRGRSAMSTLLVQSVMFDTFRLRVDLRAEAGYSAVIALPYAGLCPVHMRGARTARVEVRDARTGTAPRDVPITLELIDGQYRESHTETAIDADHVVLESVAWRAGTYVIRVRAAGYSDWEVTGVVAARDPRCGRIQWEQSIWLLPRGETVIQPGGFSLLRNPAGV